MGLLKMAIQKIMLKWPERLHHPNQYQGNCAPVSKESDFNVSFDEQYYRLRILKKVRRKMRDVLQLGSKVEDFEYLLVIG